MGTSLNSPENPKLPEATHEINLEPTYSLTTCAPELFSFLWFWRMAKSPTHLTNPYFRMGDLIEAFQKLTQIFPLWGLLCNALGCFLGLLNSISSSKGTEGWSTHWRFETIWSTCMGDHQATRRAILILIDTTWRQGAITILKHYIKLLKGKPSHHQSTFLDWFLLLWTPGKLNNQQNGVPRRA